MADPVTLFILVAAGERADLTRAMVGATHEALGASAVVVVREVSGELSDAEAMATERSERADAVVELSWVDSRHQQAALRMHVAQEERWVERSIGFLRSDADSERGRTLGFAIASVFPQVPSPSGAASARGPEPTGPMGGSPDAGAPEIPGTAPGAASKGPGGPTAAPIGQVAPAESPAPKARAPSRRLNLAVDALAVGAVGVGGNANGVGGSAALQWLALRSVSLRVGAGLKGGNIDAANATALNVFVCAGVVVHLWRTSVSRPFGAALRADYLLAQESLTYLVNGGSTQSRWLSGLGVLAEVSWRFAADVELVAGAGMEDVFARTYVDVDGAQRATLAPLSAVAETGLRLDF